MGHGDLTGSIKMQKGTPQPSTGVSSIVGAFYDFLFGAYFEAKRLDTERFEIESRASKRSGDTTKLVHTIGAAIADSHEFREQSAIQNEEVGRFLRSTSSRDS